MFWKVWHVRYSRLRRCHFVKSYCLVDLLLRRIHRRNVSILKFWVVANYIIYLCVVRCRNSIASAGIGPLRSLRSHSAWLFRTLSFVSAFLSRRRHRWFVFISLGTNYLLLLLVKQLGVEVVDIAKRIDFGFLLRLDTAGILLSILATGTHQVCKWSSLWVLIRKFNGCRLKSCFA